MLVASADSPRQILQSYFEIAPWNEESEELSNDADVGGQPAGYFDMVSAIFEMPQLICEGSYRSFCAVHQRRVKEVGRIISIAEFPSSAESPEKALIFYHRAGPAF